MVELMNAVALEAMNYIASRRSWIRSMASQSKIGGMGGGIVQEKYTMTRGLIVVKSYETALTLMKTVNLQI